MSMSLTEDFARHTPEHKLGALILSHSGDWTESDFEALPVDVPSELHDGSLILTPSPRNEHMDASLGLAMVFRQHAANPHTVSMEVDVYCGRNGTCIRKPDLLVLKRPQRGRPIPQENLVLVGEVVSPGSKDEWGDKMTDYADAGIEWYFIAQETPDGYRAELHRIAQPGRYELHSEAPAAGVLSMPEPFGFDVVLDDLAY